MPRPHRSSGGLADSAPDLGAPSGRDSGERSEATRSDGAFGGVGGRGVSRFPYLGDLGKPFATDRAPSRLKSLTPGRPVEPVLIDRADTVPHEVRVEDVHGSRPQLRTDGRSREGLGRDDPELLRDPSGDRAFVGAEHPDVDGGKEGVPFEPVREVRREEFVGGPVENRRPFGRREDAQRASASLWNELERLPAPEAPSESDRSRPPVPEERQPFEAVLAVRGILRREVAGIGSGKAPPEPTSDLRVVLPPTLIRERSLDLLASPPGRVEASPGRRAEPLRHRGEFGLEAAGSGGWSSPRPSEDPRRVDPRAGEDDRSLEPAAEVDGEGILAARVRTASVHPTPVPDEELAGAPVAPRCDERLSAHASDLRLGNDLEQPRDLPRLDPRLGVAAESAVRTAPEREAVEQLGIEPEGTGVVGPRRVLASGGHPRSTDRNAPLTVSLDPGRRPHPHNPGAARPAMVLRAKDIMDTDVLAIDEEADALSCARSMVARRKGYAIVTRGDPSAIAGIVTEWDFLEKVVAAGVDPSSVRLRDLASPTVHACSPDTPTDEVVTTMSALGVRRMVVRTESQVLGVITAKNVLAIFRQYVDKLTSGIAGYQSNLTPLG